MSLALESVCKTLGLKVIDDPATRHVAEKIIELSQHGVRGVATLHAMTVQCPRTNRAPSPYRGSPGVPEVPQARCGRSPAAESLLGILKVSRDP